MKKLRAWLMRIAGIIPRQRQEEDFSDEIESHLQMQIEDNLRAGMPPEQARRDAHLKLGGVEYAKQAHRERRTLPVLDSFLQDLRFAIRQLRRSPGFTVVAIIMLALGIGASVAIFAFVDSALLKPLPYADPNRLVDVAENGVRFPRSNLSYMDFEDWKRLNTVFTAFDAYSSSGFLFKTASGVEPVRAGRVTSGFFRTLGVKPIIGRDFYDNEDQVTAAATVLLTYSTWQKRFGGRPEIVGQTLSFDSMPTTVIGVLPEDFHFAPVASAEFWTTTHQRTGCEKRRSCHNLYAIARLKPGVTVNAALSEMKTIARRLELQYPVSNRDQGASIMPLADMIVRNTRPILIVLLVGSLLLLLISSINVASLLLVRSEGRRREFAVRGALGASPYRLLRQFVTEGMVLVGCGLALGLVAGYGAVRSLLHLISKDLLQQMPYLNHLGINLHVTLFAVAVSAVAIAIYSLTPAIRLPRSGLRDALNDGDRGSAGTLWRRLGSNLVVAELTIAMILLVAAGLLSKSFYRLLHVDLGFDPSHLATLQIALPQSSYDKNEKLALITKKIVDQASTLPGVTSATAATMLPVECNCNTNWIRVVGHPFNGEHNEVLAREVSPDYLKTLGGHLSSGRFITALDDLSRPKVSVINKTFAQKYFPGEDPLGKKIGNTELSPDSLREVVGVVDDMKNSSLDQPDWPAEYTSMAQEPDSYLSLIVHTSQDEKSILSQLVTAVHEVDPGIGTYNPTTMQMHIDDSETAYLHRSAAWLVGGFAILALLLGITGIYGVIAYSVSQRTREIGVRMALGAARSSVCQLVLREAGRLTLIGIICGIACSVASAFLIGKLLFGTRSWDLPTLTSVALLLGIAALLASYIPARRAASINPVEALRAE